MWGTLVAPCLWLFVQVRETRDGASSRCTSEKAAASCLVA